MLALVFGNAGYRVRTAADIAEAVALCNSEPFDALLSDVNIADTNGHDLVRWVARHYPHMRCVLMSGFDWERDECLVTPRCAVIGKPFRPADVVGMIDRMLARRNVA